jgi:putative transposase
MGRAAELVDAHVAETLTYYTFPDCHWIKLRTNLPDGQSCLKAFQA